MKRFLLIVCLLMIVGLNAEEFPHLILHFDINKTLIASDKTENKSIEDVINELLSRHYSAYWDETLEEPMTFDAYVRKVLLPGEEHDVALKERRLAYLTHFTHYLQEHDHPLLFNAFTYFDDVLNVLKQAKGNIFPSFYQLISELDQKGISYTLFLRSFGHEVFEVKSEINSFCGNLIKIDGKFRKGILYLDGKEPLKDPQIIYDFFFLKQHAAIHDDWPHWMEGKMHPKQGKPFYLDPEDNDTLAIFFDDNIKIDSPEENIISPIHAKTGKSIPLSSLIESKQLVSVNTLQAILNKRYYIKLVEEALEHKKLSIK